MGLPSPNSRKPSASEVVEWALKIAKNKTTINVDGKLGGQCWDLPNYILKKYWGFFTWGNANAMAQKSNYRGYNFKIYRNTKDFIPKPGDWAVWSNRDPGHVSIVVGPATKEYFWSVDQNYYTANLTGSPPYKIKHKYTDAPGGVTHFVRPPYHPEAKPQDKPQSPNDNKDSEKPQKPVWKDITKVKYTIFSEESMEFDSLDHYVVEGAVRSNKAKGIMIKESKSYRSVTDIYKQRNKYDKPDEYPHAYVDRNFAWHCRHTKNEVPSSPKWLVLEICGSSTDTRREFQLNQIRGILYGLQMLRWNNMKLSKNVLKLDDAIWRSMKELIDFDMILEGKPNKDKYEEVKTELLKLYENRKKILSEMIVTHTVKTKIKVGSGNTESTNNTGLNINDIKPKINIETSKFTFTQALNAQMSKGDPKINTGGGWFRASRTQVSNAMNPNKIWDNNKQKYQMLDLGKYQGVSVQKLNNILKGKGKLSGQGQAFADACKKYNVNEIYLMSHAFLESGNGTSNFASGRYGIYNFFGINAHDSNPNLAINYAKNKGWTTPAKGIAGGAEFVRNNYFNKGRNTLYRMRWNPNNPGTMQYATDIHWCEHQANNIYNLYKKEKLNGIYFIRDKYK